jgi:phospholipase C
MNTLRSRVRYGATSPISLSVACLLLLTTRQIAVAHITTFKHIVVVVQENRTPDNLFQGLCAPPFGRADSCSSSPGASQYNIQTDNWLNKSSATGVTQPEPIPLDNTYDLDHSHAAFVTMCDEDSSRACTMDGAEGVECTNMPNAHVHPSCPSDPQFKFVDNSSGILNPYLELATQYGWANYMFQTNQGPSFPAHQYLFGGTSAPSAADDAAGIFDADNPTGPSTSSGCVSAADSTVTLIDPAGQTATVYPCFEHETIADLLPANVTWRYYAAGNGIWTAPNAIQHICESSGPGGRCTGEMFSDNLDINRPADVLQDIMNCNLRSVSWVTPTGQNSDHAADNDGGGPSWVASIVNTIGNSTTCDGNTGYWKNTAIFITWDDWGGWYDHVPPRIRKAVQGDYELGFRVPLIVVSAYTPKRFINNNRIDFGGLLRFVEHNFGIKRGALDFADARTKSSLGSFFDLTRKGRRYSTIETPKTASFFLNDKRPATDPDDE